MASFLLGAALLVSQMLPEDPDATIVGAGLALIGVTGTGRVQEWARTRRRAQGEDA